TALLAALLLAVCPWHIRLSRVGHEAGLVPFFLTFGLLGMARAGLPPFGRSDQRSAVGDQPEGAASWGWAVFGGALLALAAWDYPAARLLVPVLVLATFLVFYRPYRAVIRTAQRWIVVGFLGGLLIGASPVWLTWLRSPE